VFHIILSLNSIIVFPVGFRNETDCLLCYGESETVRIYP
jgi:hypothetical protein